ncbi:MAG: hypothetical protein ACMZ66_18020 [Thalassospira sp.]|uniref:hypothetical protein n=1 Tax=Thalassospira sp. TaxID=1912094 RepID=UPI003A892D13
MQGHTKRTKSSFRTGTLLLTASFLLAGCQTTDLTSIGSDLLSGLSSSSGSSTSTPSKLQKVEQTSQPKLAKSKLPWGVLSFQVDPDGLMPDYWNMYVTGSIDNPNFKPYSATMVAPGQRHIAQLWPGTYRVRVEHDGVIVFEGPVNVDAGTMVLLDGEYGLFKDTIKQTSQPQFVDILPYADKTIQIDKLYGPIVIQRGDGWQLEYRGEQARGEIRTDGQGIVGIRKKGEEIVKITKAEITPTEISGTFILPDGGTTPGTLNRETMDFKPNKITRWGNGKTFTGEYDAGVPVAGKLIQLSGSFWEGKVIGDNPSGKGRYTNTDGSWVEYSDYANRDSYIGLRECGTSANVQSTCAYYKGEKLASEAELNAKIAEDKRLAELERQRLEDKRIEELAAAQAFAEARDLAESLQTANEAVAPQKRDDCTTATGTFTADNGLTSYDMNGSGSGSGHFRQRTYGSEYQFDIDFYFNTSANSISFDYGEGIYSDAGSGAILQRTSIPNGSADCTFNGRVLTIDGKEFVKS